MWIQSFGAKYHASKDGKWSLCGVSLLKDPTEEPMDSKKCKKCLKLLRELYETD